MKLVFEFNSDDMTDEEVIRAIALQNGYNETIPNPEYDPKSEEPVSETIPNPVSASAFVCSVFENQMLGNVSAQRKLEVNQQAAAFVADNYVEPTIKDSALTVNDEVVSDSKLKPVPVEKK